MIEIQARIHDKFSVEFKVGFVTRRQTKENDFTMNAWIFVPNSLDINPMTYKNSQFYRDVKSNIRLITPKFLLRDMVSGNATPLRHIESAFNRLAGNPARTAIAEYEYHIKMFAAIFKSALRDEIQHITCTTRQDDMYYLCSRLIDNVRDIVSRYRELRHIVNVPTITPEVRNYFLFGDEFMSNVLELKFFRLILWLERDRTKHADIIKGLSEVIRSEKDYKRGMGYLVAEKDNPKTNRDLIYRQGALKKYIESDLFLNARRKKDGVLVEQIYYSIAAGLSMIFATVIAFSFQQKFGNFTMPLFVALVVSYMLKDRIKELMRYFFAHRLKEKYFDNKTTISIQDREIGWMKEGMDFISDDKTPRQVLDMRSRTPLLEAENRVNDEKIILYRKVVRLDREKLETGNQYSVAGINNIVRLYLPSFTRKMDNPETPLYMLDEEGNTLVIEGRKAYYINLVMQFQFEERIDYKCYRVAVSRDGIHEIEEFK